MRARLRSLSAADQAQASAAIMQRLLLLPALVQARTLLFYVPHFQEPAILALWPLVRAMGKRTLFPRIAPSNRLTWHEIKCLTQLQPGYQGIPEPAPAPSYPIRGSRFVAQHPLILVPGLAFDRQGHRLGRGGGYYDRLLEHLPKKVIKAGLFFSIQEMPQVPTEPHDARLNVIVTQNALLSIGS